MAMLPAEAPRCIVLLDELAARSRPEVPATAAAATSHIDNEVVSPSTDTLAHDISVHVGM